MSKRAPEKLPMEIVPTKKVKDTRLHAKHFYLTYSQVGDADPQETLDAIQNGFKDNVEYLVMGIEKHQDGGNHFHVALCLKETVKVYNTYFDEFCCCTDPDDDSDKKYIHPNVQTCRNIKEVIQYCVKDGSIFYVI